MKIKTSLASVKILKENDCVPLDKCVCLSNESFSFQLYIQSDFPEEKKISIDSNIPVFCYKVVKKKGNYDINKKTDDYYLHSADDLYPELLVPTDCLKIENGEGTLFFEIPAEKKGPGEHCIEITIGNQKIKIILDVLCEELDQSDLVVTNWMHVDGICNYYHVEPFSDAFYDRFYQFLRAYVKMGNTMLLVPAFTPPLDTAVGKERLTTQLVRIYKERERYRFDFSKMEKYIDTALKFGIEYFEFSHLFTQWGGEYCPKIAVIENGVEKNIFGWAVSSADKSYLDFLRQYLESFAEFAKHYDLDVPEALELSLMKKHIEALLDGEDVYLPKYDMSGTAIRKDNVTLAVPSKIIISEGLFTLTDEVVDAFDFKIYVDVSREVQKERFYIRAAERDLGDSSDEVYENAYKKAQIYVHPTAARADIVLSGEADRADYKRFINEIIELIEDVHGLKSFEERPYNLLMK